MPRKREDRNGNASPSRPLKAAQVREILKRITARLVANPPSLLPRQLALPTSLKLAELPSARARMWIASSERAGRPEVIHTLCRQSLDAAREDAARAEHLARLALELTEAHAGKPYPALSADLEAEAFAMLANALRVQERYEEAAELWERCDDAVSRGTGDPLLRAILDHNHAALLRALRQLPAACRLAWRSFETYRTLHHGDDAFLVGLRLTTILYGAGDFGGALRVLGLLSQETVSPDLLRRHRIEAIHNLILYLTELGEIRTPQLLLEVADHYYEAEGTPNLLCQRQWIEGKLLMGQRAFREAAEVFRALRQQYLERELPFDAALVGLDLLLCYSEGHDSHKLGKLAAEVLEVFERLDLPAEAAQAVRALNLAAERARAGRDLVRQVHGLLQPLRRMPPAGLR